MLYLLSKDFIKINETSGTIQNASNIRTLEMTTFAVPDSGILIAPLQKYTFSDKTIYLRCIDGWAEARVIPFAVDSGGSSTDDSQVATDEEIYQLLDDTFV